MYTKLEDINMAQTILFYLSKIPNATRADIRRDCHTNMRRLRQLEADGYIKLPEPMPLALRNKEYYSDKNNGAFFHYAVIPDPAKKIIYKNKWSPYKMRKHSEKYPDHIIIDLRRFKNHEDPLTEQQKWLVDFQRNFENDHQAV
jgi:hypothetical protein